MENLPIHLRQSNQPAGSDQPFTSPEQAAKGRSVVQMRFPTKVLLSLEAGPHRLIMFPEGVNPVPVEIADHWYLKAHGATVYTGPEAA